MLPAERARYAVGRAGYRAVISMVALAHGARPLFRRMNAPLPGIYHQTLYAPTFADWRRLHQGHTLVASALQRGKEHARRHAPITFTPSSGCVFTDLGLTPPETS